MFWKLCCFFAVLGCSFASEYSDAGGRMAQTNGVELWYETFGEKEDPAVLLIMGGGGQSILWDKIFCEQLAGEGFYVIRYDHRDAGLSTCFDFEKDPYTLADLADDAIGLLDAIGVQKVHLFGASMGGFIAPIMAVRYPERVLSVGLLATTCDFRPGLKALCGKDYGDSPLPGLDAEYLTAMANLRTAHTETFEEQLELRLATWRVMNGNVVPLDEERNREIQTEFMRRQGQPESLENHLKCIEKSEEMIRTFPSQVRAPTVVLQGSVDPLFAVAHGERLASLIPGAKYVLVEGMGHVPNSHFYTLYIEEIKENARQVKF